MSITSSRSVMAAASRFDAPTGTIACRARSRALRRPTESRPPASTTVCTKPSDNVLPSDKIALPAKQVVVGEGSRCASRRQAAQLAALACGSPSISRVRSVRASIVARCTAVVVFPTPPLVFTTAYIIDNYLYRKLYSYYDKYFSKSQNMREILVKSPHRQSLSALFFHLMHGSQ